MTYVRYSDDYLEKDEGSELSDLDWVCNTAIYLFLDEVDMRDVSLVVDDICLVFALEDDGFVFRNHTNNEVVRRVRIEL